MDYIVKLLGMGLKVAYFKKFIKTYCMGSYEGCH